MTTAVRVYAFALDGHGHDLARYRTMLDAEERTRAAAFLDPADAVRYVVAHGVLRQILAHRLALTPQQVQITRTAAGQPLLVGASDVTFSLTHGRRHGLVAIGKGLRIGVDLEDGEPPADLPNVARLVLNPLEMAQLMAFPPSLRPAIFLLFWVRKEAVLKALGSGFLTDPRTFDTLDVSRITAGGTLWQCCDLSTAPALLALGCHAPAALAIEQRVTAF